MWFSRLTVEALKPKLPPESPGPGCVCLFWPLSLLLGSPLPGLQQRQMTRV